MTLSLPIVYNNPGDNVIEEYHPLLHTKPFNPNWERENYPSNTQREIYPSLPGQRGLSQNAGQMEFLADLLRFQTSCNHPAMSEMIQFMIKLKHDSMQVNVEKAELQSFISKHSEAIFQDIAKELYETIKTSPRLKKRLGEYWDTSDQLEIKELIQMLENTPQGPKKQLAIHEEWILVNSDAEQETIIIDTDLTGLDDLEHQILMLEQARRTTGNPREFMIEIQKLRNETKSGKPWGKRIYEAGSLTWRALSAIYYAVTVVQSAMPTVMMVAPFLLPVRWIHLIQLLLRVLRT